MQNAKLGGGFLFVFTHSNNSSSSTLPTAQLKKCQVDGCPKNRKYTAKNSGKYVCSLEHYKVVEAK